jgi:hypothetical protein
MVAERVQIRQFQSESSETWPETLGQIHALAHPIDAKGLFWRVGSSLPHRPADPHVSWLVRAKVRPDFLKATNITPEPEATDRYLLVAQLPPTHATHQSIRTHPAFGD